MEAPGIAVSWQCTVLNSVVVYFPKRYFPNSVHIRLLVFTAAAVFAGCLVSASTPLVYTATIERVEQLPANYYSPWEGPKPLVCLYLRVAAPSACDRGEVIHVFLMDLYSPEIHGQHGDSVLFSYAHTLPVSRELSFEALDDYRVVRNGG